MYDLGNFDICYDLKANIDADLLLYGKYCLTSIPISFSSSSFKYKKLSKLVNNTFQDLILNNKNRENINISINFQHAFCVPSVCSAEDMNELVKYILSDYLFLPKPIFSEEMCYSKDSSPGFTNGAMFTM